MTAEPRTVQVRRTPRVLLTADVHPGDGRLPVVLLHGLSQQRRFWGPVIRRMRARPVASLDQRAHGDSDTPLGEDVSIAACASDVVALLDELGWPSAVVVGHSWGAAVALHVAAVAPERVRTALLIDGGLTGPGRLGDRDDVRERLRPPALALPEEELWARIGSGSLREGWTAETRDALGPTFVAGDDGLLRTRIGMERHMAVLDGLLDHDPAHDLAATEASGVPVWAVVCEPAGADAPSGAWAEAREAAMRSAAAHANCRIHRWSGAVHDVPLQWPALVAGLIDASVEAGEARG